MMAKLNSFGIQSVGGLAITADNMEFYWNLCQIENGYQILLEMIPCINRIKITKEESSIMVECKLSHPDSRSDSIGRSEPVPRRETIY